MHLTDLLQQDGIYPCEGTDTPNRCNYPCPWCGGEDRFVVTKNDGIDNSGLYYCNQCIRGGNIITYLKEKRFMSGPKAFEYFRSNFSIFHQVHTLNKKDVIYTNVEDKKKFRAAASEFVTRCNSLLNRDDKWSKQLLKKRGITLETANRIMLGWNHNILFPERSSWGLPEKYKDDDSKTKLCLPAGLVIPRFRKSNVSGVRIRRKEQDSFYGKYHLVGETDQEPLFIKSASKKRTNRVIIFEGELDAIRFAQKCSTMDIYGMASASIGIPTSTKAIKRIKKYKRVIICSDNDIAGRSAAERIGADLSLIYGHDHAYYIPVPDQYGKDITEAFLNGLTLAEFRKHLKEQSRKDVEKCRSGS